MPAYQFNPGPYLPATVYQAAADRLGQTVGQATAGADGTFTLDLPAGSYAAVVLRGYTTPGQPSHVPGVELLPSLVQPLPITPILIGDAWPS